MSAIYIIHRKKPKPLSCSLNYIWVLIRTDLFKMWRVSNLNNAHSLPYSSPAMTLIPVHIAIAMLVL